MPPRKTNNCRNPAFESTAAALAERFSDCNYGPLDFEQLAEPSGNLRDRNVDRRLAIERRQ
jgi:hypothetical protein